MSATVVTGRVGVAFTNALLELQAFELRILARVSPIQRSAEMLRVYPLILINYPLGYVFADKKVTIGGDGNAKITFTTVRSTAQWVAQVLREVPVTQLQNKAQLEVEYRSLLELKERVKADANDSFAVLMPEWYTG
ncbi:hypothetical protein FRC06_011299 [Ceratobasidium sp. 370]|nr:hypothetical protein FRC06_011299 [Ceratobasidium sp. 370]